MNIDIQTNYCYVTSLKITLVINFLIKTQKNISQLISISVTSIVMHVFSKQQQDTGIKYRTFHKFERRYYITLYVQAITFSMKMLKNAEDRSTYECMGRYEFKEKYQNMNRTLNRKIFWWNLISIIQILFIYGAIIIILCLNCTSSYHRIWYWRRNFSLLFSYLHTVVEYVVLDMGTKERKWNLNKRQFFSSQDLYRPIFYAHEMKYILLFLICIEIVYPVKRPLHT